MSQYLKSKLISDVEGSCTGEFGYIICVMDGMKIDVGKGRVVPGSGSAEFEVKYRAIVWRPFKVSHILVERKKHLESSILLTFFRVKSLTLLSVM